MDDPPTTSFGRDGAQRLQECLYSAAVNGNIGLVKCLLSHSNLDGVLPLHTASSGGNYLAVKPLIEQGADMNTSSVTPEMLARDNGKRSTTDVFKEWLENKDRDLRERASPSKPTSSFGAYTFYPTKPDNETVPNDVFAPRRPSLPHICNKLLVPLHSTSSRRSRLAGQDAEPEPPRSSTTHKLGSLNLFMKYAQHRSQHTQISVYPLSFSFYPVGITFPHHCHYSLASVTSVKPQPSLNHVPT
ncbi:hypothetical protein PILCRDRAFT_15791 [Piloderma croceum F 1598]|uniref:Uncharacterized protein n=1 Tax=Piloderma croceum (strain F 1598) TaxID=765440 RepID=A0A0C3EXW6_PILCF|nr:hypothetical protein PILCRDRAFT_15791 [Piloderma croceum F 1598]